jgi:FSR family fosmidomycin resistance protein-like MFS transporter
MFAGKVGTMAGLTVGFAFGMGAVGSVALGALADVIGITWVIQLAGFLPLLGISALLLPTDKRLKEWNNAE